MPDGNSAKGNPGRRSCSRTGVPVVPAAIIGAHKVMPVGSAFPRPLPVRVVFGARSASQR